MVQFPGSRLLALCVQTRMTGHHTGRVTPFGNPRITGCVLLPEAFRSLPRPSSPGGSKASTVDSSSLDHMSLSRRLSRTHADVYFIHMLMCTGYALLRISYTCSRMYTPRSLSFFPSLLSVKEQSSQSTLTLRLLCDYNAASHAEIK